MAITVITDRTVADVQARNAKGTYNAADLNRVEANTATIAALLSAQGYPVTLSTKTDWAKEDLPDSVNMARYLANVAKCVAQFCNMSGTNLPVSMDNLSYKDANTIEQTLQSIEQLLGYMLEVLRDCGTFYCGSPDTLRGYCL